MITPEKKSQNTTEPYIIVSFLERMEKREIRYMLTGEDVILGSGPHVNLYIPSKHIADQHVCICYENEYWHIKDISKGPLLLQRDGICFRDHILFEDGEVFHLAEAEIQIFFGHTRHSQDHDKMYRRSMLDSLTGISNLRSFELFLSQSLLRLNRYQSFVSLVLFDIDHFKNFNTQYGHPGGNEVLKWVAKQMAQLVRNEEMAARIGGEEFAVVLPQVPPEEAYEIAERIRATIEKQEILLQTGQRVKITVSSGIASTSNYQTGEWLMEQADQKLYQAKNQGRNCVVM